MLSSHREQMDPKRLCDVATACLAAAAELGQQVGRTWPYPADLMGTAMQPRCLATFKRWEVEQACEFLVRLGMLERRAPFPGKPTVVDRKGPPPAR